MTFLKQHGAAIATGVAVAAAAAVAGWLVYRASAAKKHRGLARSKTVLWRVGDSFDKYQTLCQVADDESNAFTATEVEVGRPLPLTGQMVYLFMGLSLRAISTFPSRCWVACLAACLTKFPNRATPPTAWVHRQALYKSLHVPGQKSVLDPAKFSKVMARFGLTDQKVVVSLFAAWDANGDGTIDFTELLHALSIMARGTREEQLSLLFAAYDVNHDGMLSREEIKAMVLAEQTALHGDVDEAHLNAEVDRILMASSPDSTSKGALFKGYLTKKEFVHGFVGESVMCDKRLVRAFKSPALLKGSVALGVARKHSTQ